MERESMEFDVVIVGAGPSGLAAAIRLRQLAEASGNDISVCVIEKGSEVGAHILSGAVFEPHALNELIPDWQEKGAPLNTPVTAERLKFLTKNSSLSVPNPLLPPPMQNHGNYIISLGNLCRWLGEQAEAAGVEVFPGFAASEILYDADGAVRGVATGDMGVGREGEQLPSYTQGMELHAKYTFFAEGARGHLGKLLLDKYGLRDGKDPQSFAIGIKELWEIDPAKHKPGFVLHTAGWPMQNDTYGGSFLYHLEDNMVALGFVVGLGYTNPHLSPYDEFQRWKLHPDIKPYLEGGKRLSYGARAINASGVQALPKMHFPGGLLIGCDAGTLNGPKIKGSHTAMKSGMVAAEVAFAALTQGEQAPKDLQAFAPAFEKSWAYKELKAARNFKPMMNMGLLTGTLLFGIDQVVFRGKAPWTLRNKKVDHDTLKPAAACKPIDYPKPDGVITFDKLSSVFISNTNHEENQPVHLTLKDQTVPVQHNLALYDAPEQRYCPAGVYEIVREDDGSNPRLQINAQNCVHCKTCDIKDPTQNIVWVTPEGGGGPNYPNM